MPKITQDDNGVTVHDVDSGELRVVEITRDEARGLVDDLPVEHAALIEALDEVQGSAEASDGVIVLRIKAGPLE